MNVLRKIFNGLVIFVAGLEMGGIVVYAIFKAALSFTRDAQYQSKHANFDD